MNEPDEILTVTDLATYLRVHRSTIYRLLKWNRIPAFKIGSDWRFSKLTIEQWMRDRINGHKTGSSSE